MDCDTCQPTLLDLAEGQLATDAATDARAHLRECASCRGAFDKLAAGLQLSQGLDLLDPPQAVIARLHLMAEEKARAFHAQRPVPQAATAGAWRSLLDFVSRFAMARQVGMVMISLLIVAVGLWSLPQLRHVPTVAGGTVVNPDSGGEAAPAAGVRPAQRLDLKVDVRAGRIRSKEEEAQSARLPVAAEPAKSDTVVAATAEGHAVAERPAADPARALDDIDSVFEPEQTKDKAARKGAEIALDEKRVATPPSERRPVPQAPASPPAAGAGLGALAGGMRAEAKEPSAFPASQAAAAPAALPTVIDSARTRQASTSPAPKAAADSASSTAHRSSLARDEEREPAGNAPMAAAQVEAKPSDCRSKLGGLERIVAADPASARAGSALIAMALCRRQLGDEVAARALLERATHIAAVAERAKALLSSKVLVNPARR